MVQLWQPMPYAGDVQSIDCGRSGWMQKNKNMHLIFITTTVFITSVRRPSPTMDVGDSDATMGARLTSNPPVNFYYVLLPNA